MNSIGPLATYPALAEFRATLAPDDQAALDELLESAEAHALAIKYSGLDLPYLAWLVALTLEINKERRRLADRVEEYSRILSDY